jgi:hypothetical protein
MPSNRSPTTVIGRTRTVEKPLKPGDRVRLIRFPPAWSNPAYHVPWSTRDVYRRLIARHRSLRIAEVDEFGAWVRCQFKSRAGRMHYHSIVLDDGSWIRVIPRKQAGK